MAVCILAVCLITPLNALSSCQSYEAVEVALDSDVTTIVYKWTGGLSYVTADFLNPPTAYWDALLLSGRVIWQPAHYCEKCNLKPIIPPPRLA